MPFCLSRTAFLYSKALNDPCCRMFYALQFSKGTETAVAGISRKMSVQIREFYLSLSELWNLL